MNAVAHEHCRTASPSPVLKLRRADTFFLRLLGLQGFGKLAADEGVLLTPCRAIHTFFLRQPLDIVFLDGRGGQRRCIQRLPPYRVAMDAGARAVVELPGGYCERHPDYLERIQVALSRTGCSCGRNTLM
ncbi:DUF192 domain-containing protein [Achromobacter sp. F4_2707]|uniref:DUF192 domain-containing protein n=1 Tax=Achromobacter sp. F4_2707 TaxID=3114286 RepID=UPI0039C63D93